MVQGQEKYNLSLAPSIGWLFIGRIIAGVAGASFTTATAYIADISTTAQSPGYGGNRYLQPPGYIFYGYLVGTNHNESTVNSP